ncbi:MAG: hypothetical protein Q9P01_07795 [Anaerolineae bacterium]|nr:hypothetical protein [Anaerolineae bacterium]MDQ7034728.1 hypothetical protein [Anaerolineae bacterium]
MVAEVKQHIKLRGDDPYDAIIMGTNLKANLVAQFALGWGIDEAVENYDLSSAAIYAALAFYHDNLEGIWQHEKEIEAQSAQLRQESEQRFEHLKKRYAAMKNQGD